jgi:sarcosine oxidase
LDVGDVAELCATALGACGAPFEWLRPAEAMTRFPGFDFTGLERVLFHPDAGVCLADRTVAAQVRLARAGGVDVREETEVLTVRPDAPGVVLETTAGDLWAGVVVVTAGPWASRVLADALGGAGAGARALLPSLQSVAYYSPVEPAMEAAMPTFVDWHGQGITGYAVPPGGVGQGVKVGDHSHGTPIDPTQGPFEVQPATLDTIAAFVARRLPGLAAEPVGVETCLYTFTPDEDFVLDRVGDVVVGAGFSGHGFKFGPLVGEVLADLATGREPDLPAERFAVRRSALRGA